MQAIDYKNVSRSGLILAFNTAQGNMRIQA
jgi:hypothetical protein